MPSEIPKKDLPSEKPKKTMSERGKIALLTAGIGSASGIVVAIIGTITTLNAKKSDLSDIQAGLTNATSRIQAARTETESLEGKLKTIAVPVGTIVAYGGLLDEPDTIQRLREGGWLLCNGDMVNRRTYAQLFEAIGPMWGYGNGHSTFHLPDLRGVFLRGVNGGRKDLFSDPEGEQRTNAYPGGAKQNQVGSFQKEEFLSHNHEGVTQKREHASWSNYALDENGNTPGTELRVEFVRRASVGNRVLDHQHNISLDGGPETRPKNAYVHYIVKFQ